MENNNQNTETISKRLMFLNGFLVLSILSMVFIISSETKRPTKQTAQVVDAVIETANPFDDVKLTGKSAYVFDVVENKVLFKKDEFIQLPLASVTKLMTALVATETFPDTTHIKIKKDFLSEEGDSGLFVNEEWRLPELLDFSLVVSSNDGVRAIASVVGAFDLKTDDYTLGRKNFISKMNTRAQELDMKQTYFINESGLDVGQVSGGNGSAIDVAKLMAYILKNHPKLLEATKYKEITIDSISKSHKIKNTNISVNEIPELIASKTGFTDMAGGNLVVAFDSSIGRPIIVVVLGSTEVGRFEDVKALVNASLKYVAGE